MRERYWIHSEPTGWTGQEQPAENMPADIPADAQPITDQTDGCARGCVLFEQHLPGCTCTAQCPDHDNHCTGCLPWEPEVGHYCQRCADDFLDNLDQLVDLITLTATMPGGRLMRASSESSTSSRRATRVDQLSLSPATDEADEAMWWLYRRALNVADQMRHTGPFRYRNDGIPSPAEVTRHAAYLRAHVHTALGADFHAQLHREASSWRRRLKRRTGSDDLTHRLKERCPDCAQKTLIRNDGDGQVECQNRDCARVWREDEYGWLARVAVS